MVLFLCRCQYFTCASHWTKWVSLELRNGNFFASILEFLSHHSLGRGPLAQLGATIIIILWKKSCGPLASREISEKTKVIIIILSIKIVATYLQRDFQSYFGKSSLFWWQGNHPEIPEYRVLSTRRGDMLVIWFSIFERIHYCFLGHEKWGRSGCGYMHV